MNRAEAETIAEAVSIIRPDWLRVSLMTLLTDFQAKPARDVMLALVWIAYDPATKTPGRIREQGDWWATRAAPNEPTRAPYFEPYQRPAETDILRDPAAIRAIRDQAKTEGE